MLDVILKSSFLDNMGDHCTRGAGTAVCAGCGGPILDQYILRVWPDLEWHAACLKCAECSQHLDETCTCFIRDGKAYCRTDYVRLFGVKCVKCDLGFGSCEPAMRARDSSYHTRCFRCSVCGRQLVPGDEFTLRDKQLLCVADCVLLMDKPSSPPQFHCVGAPQMMGVLKQAERGTRVRTVLSEKQLLTLRTCYSVNPRPDALMKEQLVEMTGLHPRVIRVWFQNKRCKDKKKSILTKQQNHNNKTNIQGLTGTATVADSSIRHHSPLSAKPVEVHMNKSSWKTLREFALQNKLDQPAFEQLVSFSELDSFGSSSDSNVASPTSQVMDTPNSMLTCPLET